MSLKIDKGLRKAQEQNFSFNMLAYFESWCMKYITKAKKYFEGPHVVNGLKWLLTQWLILTPGVL